MMGQVNIIVLLSLKDFKMWTFIKQDESINGYIICYFQKDGMERNVGIDASLDIQLEVSGLITQWEAEDAAQQITEGVE